jgi:hypothetical protein
MSYDRDQPLYFEDESCHYYRNEAGKEIQLYYVGFRISTARYYERHRAGMIVDIEDVDTRAVPAFLWLQERGHLKTIHAFRGPHILVDLELDEYVEFKLKFK